MKFLSSLFLSFVFLSTPVWAADSILNPDETSAVVDSLQAACSDGSWCESDFRITIEDLDCEVKGPCKLKILYHWFQELTSNGHDDMATYESVQLCDLKGFKTRADLINDEKSHTEKLEAAASACVTARDPHARADFGRSSAEIIINECSTADVKSAGSRILKERNWVVDKVSRELTALSRKVSPTGTLKSEFTETPSASLVATPGCQELMQELFPDGLFKKASLSVTNENDEEGRVTLIRWLPTAKSVKPVFEVFIFEAFSN